MLKAARRLIRRAYRALGYDISRWPLLVDDFDTHLSGLLPRLGVNCVLDVGAHWGEYATSLRTIGYEGRIVSFEPLESNWLRLSERAASDSQWRVVHLALGRSNEIRSLNVPGDTVLTSFLDPTEFALGRFPNSTIQRTETSEVRPLDEAFDDCVSGISEPRVYLKMDTQGWDLEVLAGATRSLRYVVAMQSEVSVKPINQSMPDYLEALSMMHGLGFELTGLFPLSRDERSCVIEFDAVLIRA